MTVTVITIIAVIIVLAVLVLLLLGMRALSLGSREDDYDDDYEYEYDENDDPDLDRHEHEEPRGRSHRPRQDGGKAERRPRKRRGVDWEDDPDELSDNDFWSSLSEEGPAQRQPNPPGRADDDYGDPRYEDERNDRSVPPGVPSPLSSSDSGMAALANLGQESGPQQPYHAEPPDELGHRGPVPFDQKSLPPRPESSALPPTQGIPRELPPTQPVTGTSYQEDPLGMPSWASGDPLGSPSPSEHTRTPMNENPLGGVGSPAQNDPLGAPSGSYGAAGDPLGGPPPATQGPSVGDPLPGIRSPHESGTHSRHTDPYQGGTPPSPTPLDPGFRPSTSMGNSDTPSPIWSSMDTGAHQRPDPSVLRGPAPEGSTTDPGAGYGAPRPHEYPAPAPYGPGSSTGGSLSGGYPSMSQPEQGFDNGYTSHSPYDSGTHTRPTYDTDPYGLTNPNPPPQNPHSPYDSGTHTRPTYDTDPYGLTNPNPPPQSPHSPYDSGTHTRPTYDTDPYGLTNPNPPPQSPHSPYDSGMYGVPAQPGTAHPGGGLHPGGAHGYPPMPPSGGYPADQLRGEPRDYGEQPSGPYNTPGGGYPDVLGGNYPPRSPEYGGPPPTDGWGPRDQQAPDQGWEPYDSRGYPQEPYEGGYDNGRFH